MRNIAIKLRYDGSAYHGWQVQKYDVSVAATVEKALSKVCGHPVKVTAGTHRRRGPRAQLLRQLPHGEPHPR